MGKCRAQVARLCSERVVSAVDVGTRLQREIDVDSTDVRNLATALCEEPAVSSSGRWVDDAVRVRFRGLLRRFAVVGVVAVVAGVLFPLAADVGTARVIDFQGGDGNDVTTASESTFVWKGGTGAGEWTNGANWVGGTAPATDGTATIEFADAPAPTSLTTTNDFPAGSDVAAIHFNGVEHVDVTGNPIDILGGVYNYGASRVGSNTVTADVRFVGGGEISGWGTGLEFAGTVDAGGATIVLGRNNRTTFRGDIVNGAVMMAGPDDSNVTMDGSAKSFAGPLTIHGANLFLDDTVLTNAEVVLRHGDASASVGAISGNGSVHGIDADSGRVIPGGQSRAGILASTAGVIMNGTAQLVIDVNGPGALAGTDHDQLQVTGTVDLGGTLKIDSAGVPLAAEYVIIENDGVEPVSGSFQGLAPDQLLVVSGMPMRIRYDGGTGNDVTLRREQVSLWDGLGGDANWTTAANWSPDGVPAEGSTLIFPDDAAQKANNNDIVDGRFDGLMIFGAGYTLMGNAITVTRGIDANNTAGTNTVSLPIVLDGPTTTFSQAHGGTYVLDGGVTVTAGNPLTLTGSGTHTINPDKLVGGPVTVDKFDEGSGTVNLLAQSRLTTLNIDDGDVRLLGDISASVAIKGQPSGFPRSHLSGEGQIGSLTGDAGAEVTLSDGPDAGGGAVLVVDGDLSMAPQTSINVAVSSGAPVAGVTHDQVVVNGTVSLGGWFAVTASGVPPLGQEITVIDNDGSDSVVGTFIGLAEGGTVMIGGGFPARISYVGGDGNDVTLLLPPSFAWDGGAGAADTNWSTGQNWNRDDGPIGNQDPRESIVFPDSILRVANNNLAPGRVFDDIQISGDGHALTGNPIRLDSRILAVNESGTTSYSIPTSFTGNDGVIHQVSGGTIDLNDTMIAVGGGSLTLSGAGNFRGLDGVVARDLVVDGTEATGSYPFVSAGIVTIDADQSLPGLGGSIDIKHGTVMLDGDLAQAGVTVEDGVLRGSGTARGLDVLRGDVSPGGGTGIMSIAGNLDIGYGATLWLDLNGPTAGAQHDQLDVAGTVTLAGQLLGTASAAMPNGTAVTIIENDGTDPVLGSFLVQPNNSALVLGGRPFTIRYDGGDGNDVVLVAEPHVRFSYAASHRPENTPVPDEYLDVVLDTVQATDVTVHVEITAGTGTAGSDVSALDQDLTIPAGQTSVRVPLYIINDPDREDDETVVITLTAVTPNVGLEGPSTFTLTIWNDDFSVITVPPTTAPPATTAPHSVPSTPLFGTLAASAGTVEAGASITFSAEALCANAPVAFIADGVLGSTVLGTRTTDATGSATFTTDVALPPGTYTIIARTAAGSCSVEARATLVVTQRIVPPGGLPSTGGNTRAPLTLATIVVVAGVALVAFATRRRSAPGA